MNIIMVSRAEGLLGKSISLLLCSTHFSKVKESVMVDLWTWEHIHR